MVATYIDRGDDISAILVPSYDLIAFAIRDVYKPCVKSVDSKGRINQEPKRFKPQRDCDVNDCRRNQKAIG
jgi:hypothetical protein